MKPIIEIALGPWGLVVSAYRLMLVIALAASVTVALFIAGRLRLSRPKLAWVIGGSAAGAVGGARILAVLGTLGPDGDIWSRLFSLSAGDFSLYGGLIGGALVGWGLCRVFLLRPWRAADALAPAVGAGIVFMRIGCLLSGCCCGQPTHLPWGITYPFGSTPHLRQIFDGDSIFAAIAGPVPVHPFPVYDMASALIGALLGLVVIRRGWRQGSGMAVFVIWYSTSRLLLEPFRADTGGSLLPGWFWPGLFLAAAVASGVWLVSNQSSMGQRVHPRFG